MSGLLKPKPVKKEIKKPETDKKRAKTTKEVIKSIKDRQTTDSNQ
jgi:hypothetical protein